MPKPQTVRNYWLIANVDGRSTPVEAGPRAADGGFTLVVLMREDGAVSPQRVYLTGRTINGRLHLEVSSTGLKEQPMIHKTSTTLTYTLRADR